MMEIEKRSGAIAPELRADGEKKTLVGYAAVFNSEANIGDYFREVIKPGAFADTLRDADVLALFGHDTGRVLGRSKSGTLRLKEDSKGLAVEIDLPDTTDGRDLGELVARGDIEGMSFGFRVTHDEWDETVEPNLRTIHKVELREVSATPDPAYTDTTLALRSRDAAKEQRGDKTHNRDAYLRRKAAQEQKFRGI